MPSSWTYKVTQTDNKLKSLAMFYNGNMVWTYQSEADLSPADNIRCAMAGLFQLANTLSNYVSPCDYANHSCDTDKRICEYSKDNDNKQSLIELLDLVSSVSQELTALLRA